MSYAAGETLLLAQVIACTGFDANNTSQADWGILNSGKAAVYAILRPGAWNIEWTSYDSYTAHYTTIVEVWQRWKDDTDTHTSLYANVNYLMAMMAYPHIGGTIEDMTIDGADEPEEMWTKSGAPSWLRWTMRIRWDEVSNVTFAE